MTSKSDFLTPFLLFILSFWLRLSLISNGPYDPDCLQLVLKSLKTLETGILQNVWGFGYPVTVLLSASFITILKFIGIKDPVLAVNFMSVVMGSLCVPLFYIFVKKSFSDDKMAILSATALSICPIFLSISTYGTSHTPAIVFLLYGLIFIYKYFETKKINNLLIGAVFIGILGGARMQDMIFTMPALSALILFDLFKKDSPKLTIIKNFFLFIGGVIITTFLLHLPFLLSSYENYTQQFLVYQGFTIKELPKEWVIIKGLQIHKNLLNIFGDLVFILWLIGLTLLFQQNRKMMVFCSLWLIIPIYWMIFQMRLTFTPRFLIFMLPAIIIPVYFSVVYFYKRKPVNIMVTIFILITTMVLPLTNILPKLIFRHQHSVIKDLCNRVKENSDPSGLIMAYDDVGFIEYYTGLETMTTPPNSNSTNPAEHEAAIATIRNLLNQGRTVYITNILLKSDNKSNKQFEQYLKNNFELIPLWQHLYEDWHEGPLLWRHHRFVFYKLQEKAPVISH